MFNLLMQGGPWSGSRDTVSLGRMFEYTDVEIAASFRNGGRPRLDELIRLPCLFMEEGLGDQIAHVGTIIRARIVGQEVAIEYAYDTEAPRLLNHIIHANRRDFDMTQDFEFSRTHWAVKDVDLYRTLLRNFQPRRQRPTVFQIPEHESIDPELASAMMPFDAGFSDVYAAIRLGASDAGLRCRRADDIWENASIIQDVVSLIDRSRVVICDCTGRNPNMFYEAGIAHTLGREVILVTQNAEDIPFDLRHLRYIRYLNNAEGRRALTAALGERLRAILEGSPQQ